MNGFSSSTLLSLRSDDVRLSTSVSRRRLYGLPASVTDVGGAAVVVVLDVVDVGIGDDATKLVVDGAGGAGGGGVFVLVQTLNSMPQSPLVELV